MAETALSPQPLYRRARAALVARLADGRWQAGQLIPSEFEIARELGVSQGTVRKALDEMAADSLLVRRQGVGTFVAKHDDARVLFRFFRLTADRGERIFPESRTLGLRKRPATAGERESLALAGRAAIVEIRRVRLLDDAPAISETIVAPAALVPGLEAAEPPNNLYALYESRYGISIARATERLKAVAADVEAAAALGLNIGAPLLAIDRVAYSVDGRAVEWRVSLCRTDAFHYASELR